MCVCMCVGVCANLELENEHEHNFTEGWRGDKMRGSFVP